MAVAVDHSGFVEVEAHDARAALAELLNLRQSAMDKPETTTAARDDGDAGAVNPRGNRATPGVFHAIHTRARTSRKLARSPRAGADVEDDEVEAGTLAEVRGV
jgi:hypothetical protein